MQKIGKAIICFIILILMMFSVNRIMYQIDKNLENYNDSYVYETNGIVTSALYTHLPEGDRTSITIKTNEGDMAKIYQNGDVKYSPLQEITIFTDGINFALTKEEIVPSRTTQLDLYFIALIPIIVIMYSWWKLFRWKGLILSLFFISILTCC